MHYVHSTAVIFCTALFCNIFLSTQACYCQSNNEDLYSMYEETLLMYQGEKFDEAIKLALAIREKYPEEPAGAFGLLTTYQTISRNYRVKSFDAQIDSLLNLSVKLSKKAVKRDRKNGINYFYLGCSYGFRSLEKVKQQEWMEAFRDGSQVLKNFKKALVYSPDFYDTHYGLGLYKYWFGAKGVMRYLPFAKQNRSEGLAQMKITIDKGRFLQDNARYGLLAAYFNEEQYEDALQLSDYLIELYPNNPTIHYRRGRIYQALQRWSEAVNSFNKLYEILVSTPYRSTSYQIENLYQIAKCEHELKNYFTTQKYCEEALALEAFLDFSQELNGPIEHFSEIQTQLSQLYDEVNSIDFAEASGE